MADLQLLDCFQPELVRLERVRYFPRQLLTPDDMTTDSDYFRQKLRRHNRYLHGWGVVCGLEVIARPIPGTPWRVQIGPGYALGPYGDEIYVAEPVYLDLAQCGPGAATSPCEPDMLQRPEAVEGETLYVAIKYAECVSRPVRAMPAGCACEEVECEYSRIRDSFEIGCLTDIPVPADEPLLCRLIDEHQLPACPPCPVEPWVVLAQVQLPAPGTELDGNIDNVIARRQLHSTALLQKQLIECCCGEIPTPVDTANLSIVKQVDEDKKNKGNFICTITVTNLGPSLARNVRVVDDAPAGEFFGFTNFMPQKMWTPASQTPGSQPPFLAEVGNLAQDASRKLTFRMRVATTGKFQNTATVSADNDPNSPHTAMATFSIAEGPK